jgi:predicted phosphodiesterase
MEKLLSILVLCSGLAAGANAEDVVAGPIVVNVGPRTATVVWLVSDGNSTLGESPTAQTITAQSLQVRKTVYSNLKGGTTYYYTVPGGGTGHFKTPPAPPRRNEPAPPPPHYTFVVYGDTRTRHDVHAKVMAAVEKTNPDFVVHTGDLVSTGSDVSLWAIFFNIENAVLSKTAFYPALGNHERNANQYYEFLDARSAYYSFNWGNSHFSILNSDIVNAAPGTEGQDRYWKEQVAWLEQDLAKSRDADFRFVVCHHPPFTSVSNRQGDNAHIAALVPLMERYKVTAMFNGHDHNYQHFEKNHIHYVTTGGGGAPLYDVEMPPAYITRKVEKTENFVRVQVDGRKAAVEALGPDSRVIDKFELGGGPGSSQ